MMMMTQGPQGRDNSPKRFHFIGLATILTIFGGLFLWSVIAPFEGAIISQGTITVESEHKAIQHLEGGIVAEIHAREGQSVAKGDLLIRLDGTSIQARLSSIDAQLNDLIAREARLIAERDGKKKPVLRDAYVGKSEVQSVLDNQIELLVARLDARNTRIAILNQKIDQMNQVISGSKADIASKFEQVVLLNEEITSLQTLVDKGLSPKPRLLALQRERSQMNGAIETIRSEIAATEVRIGETRLEMIQLKEGFLEEVLSELNDVQTKLATLLEERAAAFDQISRLEIRSPRAGIVLGIRTHTLGGVVGAGTPIMFIVPRDDVLVAKVRVLPMDVDKIFASQIARVRFSAFNQKNTPETDGEVLKVSPDIIQDENTGQSYYEAIINLNDTADLKGEFQLVPGMPVEVILRTDSRNAFSYLTKPLFDSVERTFRE